jgi:hypothetical protein
MQDIYKSWKVKGRKVSKTSSPMIGMVYKGLDKFFGKQVVGVLIEIYEENDEAVLRTSEDKLISVDKNSLKIVA